MEDISSAFKEYYGEKANDMLEIKKEAAQIELDAYKTKIKSQTKLLARRKQIVSGIKEFWFEVLMQSDLNPAFIDAQDNEALKALQELEVVFGEDPRAFTVVMTFGDNKFFEDKKLSKEFVVDPDLPEVEKYSIDADPTTKAVSIRWKGDNVNLVKHKPRNDAIDAEEFDDYQTGSFFSFFTEATDPAGLSAHLVDIYLTAHDIYARLSGAAGEEDASEDEEDDDEDPTAEINLSDDDRPKKKRKA